MEFSKLGEVTYTTWPKPFQILPYHWPFPFLIISIPTVIQLIHHEDRRSTYLRNLRIIYIYRPVSRNLLMHKGYLKTLQTLRRPQISVNSRSLVFFKEKFTQAIKGHKLPLILAKINTAVTYNSILWTHHFFKNVRKAMRSLPRFFVIDIFLRNTRKSTL